MRLPAIIFDEFPALSELANASPVATHKTLR